MSSGGISVVYAIAELSSNINGCSTAIFLDFKYNFHCRYNADSLMKLDV